MFRAAPNEAVCGFQVFMILP